MSREFISESHGHFVALSKEKEVEGEVTEVLKEVVEREALGSISKLLPLALTL